MSGLLANIALSVLDEHLHAPWEPGGSMSTAGRRARRAGRGEANWRIVRYADDFAVLVRGERHHAEGLREEIASLDRRLPRLAIERIPLRPLLGDPYFDEKEIVALCNG